MIGLNLVISIADGALPEFVTQHLGLGNKLVFLLIFLLIFCNLFIKKSENNLIDQKFFTDPVDPTNGKGNIQAVKSVSAYFSHTHCDAVV